MTPSFPLPPGVNEADINRPTSRMVNFGDHLTLYIAHLELGGLYRFEQGVWTLFYPVGPETFAATIVRFLDAAGIVGGQPVQVSTSPPGQHVN